MPRTNTTIDNVSPLISYQPTAAWRPGTKATDPLFLQYSNGGTFYLTQIYGASASFSFNGTGVWIFGAKRPNHGPYNITLTSGDGASSTGSSASSSGNGAASTGSGASSSGAGTSSSGDVASSSSDVASFTGDGASAQPIFQTPLFIAKDLPQGKHEVVISNAFTDAGNDFLDIDFITWESEIGGDGEGLTQTLVQDTDPAWVYEPVAAWSTSLDNLAGYSSGTGHGSSTDGSTATLTFSGDGVHIFGTVGPQNSNYTVQLDSASPPTAYNASSQTFAAQTLLWGAAGLGPGEHNVTLTSRPVKAGLGLNIDYAVLLTTGSISGASSEPHSGLSPGAIAGTVLGVLALLALLAAAALCWRRRRSKVRRHITYAKPEPFVQPPTPARVTMHRSQMDRSHGMGVGGVQGMGGNNAQMGGDGARPPEYGSDDMQSYLQPDYGYQDPVSLQRQHTWASTAKGGHLGLDQGAHWEHEQDTSYPPQSARPLPVPPMQFRPPDYDQHYES